MAFWLKFRLVTSKLKKLSPKKVNTSCKTHYYNSAPTESLILKVFHWEGLINFNSVITSKFNLFHSLMAFGMKEFFKYSHLQETVLKNWHFDGNFSLTVVNHIWRIPDQLKKTFYRSRHRRFSGKKVVVKSFQNSKFTENHLCWSLALNKVADLRLLILFL